MTSVLHESSDDESSEYHDTNERDEQVEAGGDFKITFVPNIVVDFFCSAFVAIRKDAPHQEKERRYQNEESRAQNGDAVVRSFHGDEEGLFERETHGDKPLGTDQDQDPVGDSADVGNDELSATSSVTYDNLIVEQNHADQFPQDYDGVAES